MYLTKLLKHTGGARVFAARGISICCRPHSRNQMSSLYSYGYNTDKCRPLHSAARAHAPLHPSFPPPMLKHRGMPQQQLSVITQSIIVSRILYAFLAWGGFVSVELKNGINALFKRRKRSGYIHCAMTINDLINRSFSD